MCGLDGLFHLSAIYEFNTILREYFMSLTLQITPSRPPYLIDSKERVALNEGLVEPLDFEAERDLRLFYGVFKPQPSLDLTHS